MNLPEALARVKTNPEDPHGWVLLGKQLTVEGKMMEAKRSFEHALYLDPSLEQAYDELLRLERSQGAPLPDWLERLDSELYGRRLGRMVEVPALLVVVGALAIVISLVWSSWLMVGLANKQVATMPATVVIEERTPGSGQTREEAIPLGQAHLMRNGFSYKVVEVLSDPMNQEVTYFIDQDGNGISNTNSATPPDGMRPFLLRLVVENVEGTATSEINTYGMSVIDGSGVSYDDSCWVGQEDLGDIEGGKFPRGEKTEGVLCFVIPRDEDPHFFVYESEDGAQRRYFSLAAEN